MAAAPARVAALGDVNETLALTGHVGVVVHAENVAEVVEGDLLHVAQAVGEDLEAAAVRFAAHDAAFVRVIPAFALLAHHVRAFVANAPVDAAIGADAWAVHVVSRVGDVHAETMRDDLPLVGDAVVIRIAQAHEIRRDGDVNPAFVIQDARRDAGDDAVKTLGKDRHLVRCAIAIGVAKLVNALAVNGEVLPVDGAVLVVIFEVTAWQPQLPGGEFTLQEGFLFFDAGQRDVVRDPRRVLADVEVRHLAPRGGRNVDATLFVRGDGHGIGHVEIAGPPVEFERGLRLGLGGLFLSTGAGEGEKHREGGEGRFFHEDGAI